jgi:hypothetical protein
MSTFMALLESLFDGDREVLQASKRFLIRLPIMDISYYYCKAHSMYSDND